MEAILIALGSIIASYGLDEISNWFKKSILTVDSDDAKLQVAMKAINKIKDASTIAYNKLLAKINAIQSDGSPALTQFLRSIKRDLNDKARQVEKQMISDTNKANDLQQRVQTYLYEPDSYKISKQGVDTFNKIMEDAGSDYRTQYIGDKIEKKINSNDGIAPQPPTFPNWPKPGDNRVTA